MCSTYIVLLVIIITLRNCHSLIPIITCSTTFLKKSGTFSSPSFYKPDNTNPQSCKWRILASPDEKITLNITEIDIEKTPNCKSGHVEVRDGYWEDSPLLGKYCGKGFLDPITSTSNKMLISYVHKVGYRGFLANYDAICGEVLYVRSKFLLHSNNPQEKYPLNRKCIWKIIVPERHQVVVQFQKFRVEHEKQCLFDYVDVDDSNGTLIERYCGDGFPENITSTSNTLTIKFVSDASIQRDGFSLLIVADYNECITKEHECEHECINTIGSYKCACRKGYELDTHGRSCEIVCGGTLKARNGTIHSPFFPHEYPPNKTCIWELVASTDHVIHLNFTHFDLEGDNVTHSIREKCGKDKLELFSEVGKVSKRVGTYCGSMLPDLVVSEGNNLKIVFSTDDAIERSGFALNYSTVEDKCDKFGGNCHHKCVTLKTHRKCVCPETYTSANNIDCIKGCQYEISSFSGTISTPNFPNYYPNNQNCTWKFKTTPGHIIKLTFSIFQTQSCVDYVAIYNGISSSAPSLGTLCGTRSNTVKISTDNELYVNFVSDGLTVYHGFKATYLSVCGGTWTATATEKYIFSHDLYGLSNYYNNTECVWIIKASSGYKTWLAIEVLEVEQSHDCEYDYVEVVDGSTSRGKFCGKKPPEEFVSGGTFTIKFHTDNSMSAKGFRLVYKTAARG